MIKFLSAIKKSILSDLSDEEINLIEPLLKLKELKKGEILFDEGEIGNFIYLIVEGKLTVTKGTRNDDVCLETHLETGEIVGEMAILEDQPRSAKVQAVTKSKVLLLTKDDLLSLVKLSPTIGINLAMKISNRLRKTDTLLAEQLSKSHLDLEVVIKKYSSLIEVTREINSSLDLQVILRTVLDIAKQNLNAERGTIYVYLEQQKQLLSKILDGDEFQEIRLPLGTGIAGQTALTRKSCNIKDVYTHPTFAKYFDEKSNFKTKSMLCVPIISKNDELVGVFQLLNKKSGYFTDDDVEFLELIASGVAMAIFNAKLYQQVGESERMIAVGKMASSIIHDIKNPLSVIGGYVNLIQLELEERKIALPYPEKIMKKVRSMDEMLKEILLFARGNYKLTLTNVQPKFLILEILADNSVLIEQKNIQITCDFDFQKTHYQLDFELLRRALQNIILNAVDALPKGGSIVIYGCEKNENIEFYFKDNGKGIPEEIRDTLFEPFTSHGKAGGTGLGTSIAKKIIEAHKGTITFETKTNHGTTFKILIPNNLTNDN
ncbi:GAF domain-containing protein [bacterium]|nr:GAF domain-containing protein [bacterium]